ncbi:MAG: FixH family protein, partial [Novosphingobium sp.]
MSNRIEMTGELTGRKVAAIFVVFFGVIMAVNFTMARFASSTFGGVVVENSYVASQKFNGWLEAARVQQQLGWQVELARLPDDRVALRIKGATAQGMAVIARARHPLGRAPAHGRDRALERGQLGAAPAGPVRAGRPRDPDRPAALV